MLHDTAHLFAIAVMSCLVDSAIWIIHHTCVYTPSQASTQSTYSSKKGCIWLVIHLLNQSRSPCRSRIDSNRLSIFSRGQGLSLDDIHLLIIYQVIHILCKTRQTMRIILRCISSATIFRFADSLIFRSSARRRTISFRDMSSLSIYDIYDWTVDFV